MHKILLLIFIQIISCGTKEPQNDKTQLKDIQNIPVITKKDTSSFDYESRENELKTQLSEDFIVTHHSCFVVASNLSKDRTNQLIRNTISNAEECFYNDYFETKPDELITIFLFKDDSSYRNWAAKLYGDTEDLSRFGYYKPSQKAMLMNINTGSGTLIHEMTHAFVRYDFPGIPSWFNEGLGSLYERCSMEDGVILGHTNWRLPELQSALKDKSYTSLDNLLKTDDDTFYGDNSSFHYAQARYLCQYLQEKKLLKTFYKKFRDGYEKDKTGKKFLEEVTGLNIGELDNAYQSWSMNLKQSD
ncbi:MAG: hypothetical protein LWX07_05220 [Bacteroidetes bacterium]|nr:hypothetical protein [Bacteroidota bacterium]